MALTNPTKNAYPSAYDVVTTTCGASVKNTSETVATVTISIDCHGTAGSGGGPAQYGIVGQVGYTCNNTSNYADVGRGVANYGATIVNGSKSWNITRTNVDQYCECWAKIWGETVNGYGAWGASNGDGARVAVTIPARPYHTHGNPTLSTIKTTAHYGEVLTLSFAKSETQGNANFDHFELYQGDTRLYKGTDTSYAVTPSDVTGAKGGTATYTLKEVHEWYGGYKTTETSISIKVQSGVVTIYDENRVKHVGLVTMYDEKRVKHYVLITAYDKDGNAHNVV